MRRPCKVFGCELPVKQEGMCSGHYFRKYRGSTNTKPIRPRFGKPPCSVKDCDKPHLAQGMCGMHYYRVYRTGSIEGRKKGRRHEAV